MDKNKKKILIIDDEEGIRDQFKWSLKQDYKVLVAGNAEEGIELFKSEHPDLVVSDIALSENGDQDGLQLFEDIQLLDSKVKVIIITGNEQRELAFKAVQMGAYDFYKKPIDLQEFKIILKRALHLQKLESEIQLSTLENSDEFYTPEIIGKCQQMSEVYDIIERTSATDATILITGESGTGKELVAKALHMQSPRKDFPFVVINCGAIPENLLESELFGHEKGAFTGAHVQRKGRIERANQGTVFLDEIGELSVALQVKLLRFFQEREIERVGGREPIQIDVRIIAATNRNLEEEIEKERFRPDLFYRLSVIPINLPPLREREQDIFTLANHFLNKFNLEHERKIKGFSREATKLIQDYSWPGNIRELENKVKRAVIMTKNAVIIPEDFNLKFEESPQEKMNLRKAVEEFEENCIRQALLKNDGNVSRTAQELGINRTTFYDMLNRYNIDRADYASRTNKAKSEM
ncbi:PEP-CTERM-box response regulator transcription factor [candidate division KSB1 bacterium]|nr:PEP-CTERM-box response regulator transcription factor [candidate division KSB1 bacterium]